MSIDLKTSLAELADAEYADAPASTVDIGKARTDGRRRVLAARLAPIGGGVAVVAACALVASGLGGTSAATRTGPAAGAPAAHQFSGTDPLTATAAFGWLPAGWQTTTHMSGGDYGATVTAYPAQTGSAGATRPALALTALPGEMQLRGGQTKSPATVAGSTKAYLVSTAGDASGIPADLSLEWQTASGSWFSLGGDDQVHGDQLRDLLIRVADAVRADGSAVALPIHIEGLPSGVTLGEASLSDPVEAGVDGFTVGLSYHSGTAGPGTGHYFSVTVSPAGLPDPSQSKAHPGDPNDPSKAGVKLTPANPAPNTCKDSEGLHICVQDDPKQAGPDPLASVGGAQGLLDRITSLGTDRAKWTTHVVN